MKWYVELYNYRGEKKIDFEACLDTPVYMYKLQTRYNLKKHIKKFAEDNQGKILTKEELDLLCWEIDCLRESDKHFNNLGKEKVYFRITKSWSFPPKKYIPSRSLILSSNIYSHDGNLRRDWLKGHKVELEKAAKTKKKVKEKYKILVNFPSDKTLIKEIIEKILSYGATNPIRGGYRFTLYINIYYTFCYESRNT